MSPPCELGITLYQILFEEFGDAMQRQEIVGRLVTHVGSGLTAGSGGGGNGEVDAALRVFCAIVDRKKSKRKDDNDRGEEDGATALRPFTPFLTSMLDHLHNMTTGQVRRLFLLLFAVGLGEGAEGEAGMQDISGTDVGIVIQKHLSLAPFAKKRIVSSFRCCLSLSQQET